MVKSGGTLTPAVERTVFPGKNNVLWRLIAPVEFELRRGLKFESANSVYLLL